MCFGKHDEAFGYLSALLSPLDPAISTTYLDLRRVLSSIRKGIALVQHDAAPQSCG
jgi:hypothetical protein